MGQPDWPHHRFLDARDMSATVAWTMILRNAVVY
jgi:hypothetical protein